ncbi:hypothetical protein C6500_16010 [Candidatus Poribacteria bacterium]|nr:MAG: hypothetical protein C6500_16010 [Candidatus Poribacteria bacterium]
MKAQHTHTENEERLSTILNSVSDAIIATDQKGLITFMNPAAEILTGWEFEEVSGKDVTDILNIYAGNAGNLIKKIFLIEALQKGSVTTEELSSASEVDRNACLIAKSGREIPIDYNITPIKDGQANATGNVITFHEIIKYKTKEEQLNQTISELRHQTRLMKTVFDSMSEGIVVLSLAGHVLFINPSIQQIFGTEPLGGLFSKWSEEHSVFYPDKETRVPIDQILATQIFRGEAVRDQELFVRSEKHTEGIYIMASALPLFDENQEVVACVCVVRNIVPAELETLHSFDGIVGKSQIMQPMFALMQRAVESDIAVFISGESGTGKELVAHAIHANSPRKGGPFITVNCAAIPETLIESELFGHERGAFTGATTKRIGKFERANQGTIFLDEIGDMQLALQAKLLRVLQERRIQRVGGTGNIPIDIRVVTATNQNLEAAMEAGNFREDLFYRIATFPIIVPPLRDRREDIPLLVNHFLKKYSEKLTKSIRAISADALRLLMQYDFPGNVRELENTIERAVLLETTELLQPSSLPPQILSMISSQPILSSPNATEILPFEEVERQTLAHALKVMDNNVTKAAQALKIPRTTFYRKLKLYQLSESD